MTFRCRVYDVSESVAKIIVTSLSASAITAECSQGDVVVGASDTRYNKAGTIITATLVTISNLPAFSKFTYTITQDGVTIGGSPSTIVGNQTSDYGFILSTCDRGGEFNRHQRYAYTAVKKVMQEANEPVTTMLHIDDLFYSDSYQVNDATTGIVSTGKPEDTNDGEDYAAVYAAYIGLLPTESGWDYTDRQWVYRNLSCCASGGDHAIARNHCRGGSVNGVNNPDYWGCDRSVGGLEETAKAEWDAFVGQASPTLLRADKWHWGKVIGSIRFALIDYSLYADPYDQVLNNDPEAFGTEQLGDIRTHMNVDTEPFKCFLFESGIIQHGQPWRDWHPTEADTWKTEFDGTANYITSGTAFMGYGDNHSPHVISLDTSWGFCAGMLENSQIVNQNMESDAAYTSLQNWGGQNKWSEHATAATGDRAMSGFWHFRVLQSQSPKKITAEFKDGGTGNTISPVFELLEGATNNQWTMVKAKFG